MESTKISLISRREVRKTTQLLVVDGKRTFKNINKLTAFLTMDEKGVFGWMWKISEIENGIYVPGGVFEDIQTSPEIMQEIKARRWNEKMSAELKSFVDFLWQKFCSSNPDWKQE